MIADCEDLQKSGASEIHIKRFKSQDIIVQEPDQFPCANGTQKILGSPRPSSTAERNAEQEGLSA